MTPADREASAAAASALPIEPAVLARLVERLGIDVRRASIREMNTLVNAIEAASGVRFIRMEFGIPGLHAPSIAIEAERAALPGVAHVYAPFEGVAALKQEAARFAKLFLDLELPPSSCIPTVGAMQGCFAAILLASRMHAERRTVLLLEPGFPVNRLQLRLLGLPAAHIDFYDHRGARLLEAVERRAEQGDLCAILWSSPNNPSWINLDASELAGLGRICDAHELLAIEDLAYFGMDTRHDYYTPGRAPFQPTVLRYTERAISIISSSKIFSYAGQRIALNLLPPALMAADLPELRTFYGTGRVGHAYLHGALYPVTASVPQAPQYGLLALLRAANAGDRSVFAAADAYTQRAREMKRLFLANGFRLVYDNDLGEPLADGFYFTVSYPPFDHGADLITELLRYGVSAITLETTGSCRVEGLRACVSMTAPDRFGELEARLRKFHDDHPI